jgi:tetratricopeptide (TPR) repeat protein
MQTKLVLLLTAICLLALTESAQSSDRDMNKESAIWEQLKAVAPAQVETFKAATLALDNGDYKESAHLYDEVYKKAPAFDPVMRRLGMSLVALGKVQEGIKLLEMAVKKNPSPENLASLAQYLAYPGENRNGTTAEKERALALAKQAYVANKDPDPSYAFLVADLSLDLKRESDFRLVMKTIDRDYPDLMATHYFRAIRAAMDEDWEVAEDEIKIAQGLGLPSEMASRFLGAGVQSRATVWRYTYYALYMVAAWSVGLALLFVLGKIMSNLTLRWIDTSDPNAPAGDQQVSLRRLYRRLINVAGLYYYISIPVVIFLVIAVTASIGYGFLMAGRVPIKLAAILLIGALVTVFTMIRSLFIRIKYDDPGRGLTEQEAPGLWALAKEVASSVGTRPVDEIRVTPGTEMAVYESGSFRERSRDQAKRILIVGVGILNDFKQVAFRAVLAHEYGHFSHRDTAGGDVAIRVNNDMMKFAQGMAAYNQAVWWNIAFQFLRVYHFIFRRISRGATRLQEILADRVAVRNYGAGAFEEGLRHVVRRQVEFNDIAEWEITDAAKMRRPLQNLYEIAVTNKNLVEEQVEEAINRATSDDDTHPSPIERFRYAQRIRSANQLAGDGLVWDLFANRQQLTGEMSALIDRKVRAAQS